MKAPESDPIVLSTQLVSSLLEEIPLVQNFKGKWVLIRAKLDDLRSQLGDFADFSGSVSNSLSVDLLGSVSAALSDAVSLARRCQSPNLAEGKLRTQSDIDAVLAKLDRVVKDGEILIRSGVLQEGGGGSTGVSSSSRREAVRSESRNLITRLQIGSGESRNSAMDSLLELLQEDDKNVMIAVAQGVVPVLVRLMDSSSAEMKEKTVAAISRVSVVDSSKHVLIAEGLLLLNHLLRVLDSGSAFAREKACVALQALSLSKENARAIGSRGGIESLLEICQAGTPGSQASAADVLRNLASFPEIKENFIEENGVVVLLGLASSGTVLAQEKAIGCLRNLVSDDESLKLSVVKEGGIECLKNFWVSAPSVRSLEVAVDLLRHLASFHPVAEVLCSEGFIARLVGVLNCGVLGVRIAAARAVFELGFCSRTRKEMGECGCIGPLIKMLDGKAVEEREAAAKALSNLVLYLGNRKMFKKDEKGIVSAVQLLDPSIKNLDKKYPVSLLASLSHSKRCRKHMVAAGASAYLQKVVEMEVEGSKKLLESLGRGKIWGVFG
ncbi:Beta-catenin [Parasponia andersonii]|uniref:Beta-catenin n=1 Tax=Parasponia andersonii TaxID=3476 RepID=A0A2P5DV79_PARAD|nr:Beta-catenin [Parasponia andersonii]